MTLDGSGTSSSGNEAPAAPDTLAPVDEVTTLKSRNAGLDAKVTELQKEATAAKAAADAAAAKLADYEAGKVGADEALRAQLQVKEAELTETRKLAALARIEARFPETFGVLGAAAASLTEDQLAASEARFAGVAAPPETPRPVGANPQRPTAPGTKALEDMTADELRKHLATFSGSVWGLPSD